MANLGYIQIIRICNQECLFCSNPATGKVISLDEAKKTVDDYIKLGYEGLIWTGGEPTLYPHLVELIQYAKDKNIHSRLITNGQKICNYKYFKRLADAGLDHVNISLFSHRPKMQAFLTKKKDSFKNIVKALRNAEKLGITVNINTVINKYNSDHLSEVVKFVVEEFPFVRHFVWNNMDPLMNRASKNIDTIPTLNGFELELHQAMKFLDQSGRTFRVERVPLCYMVEYGDRSTETRKIVKKEERSVHFLDDARGRVRQTDWQHGKAECCKVCKLNNICAGLWQMDKYYFSKELYPVFVDPKIIEKRILEDEN